MRKTAIVLLTVLCGYLQANAFQPMRNSAEGTTYMVEATSRNPVKITILEGSVILELRKGVDFPCIGLRLSDKNTNKQVGTYMEVKKRGEFYYLNEYTKYRNMDKGIEKYLKELFRGFYENKKYGKKVWAAFVKEGGLQKFLDTAKEFIDDEFLYSPFNTIYG